ncbi:YafY family protein [Alkalihalobacillus sp. AL-G]|uniref:helix-turn-helix transcriptional regulator n=1 Tax=Alkalihalobacillus sp. AL-G TaxID=2926399 RepID=UPI00272D4E95|nr:WYL domain-containing protein [Alkalihalobacillus sp. AL-G]WLD94265.1 WYL domain-containing protein [Alkalihalobacillus sp. AL-G]
MSDISNKQRLLKIRELFEADTDEENELSLKDLKDKLRGFFGNDYDVRENALRDDMRELNESDFCIIENEGKYGKKFYSHQERLFELYELRMLIDAVVSARFITKKESRQLIEKIKKLTSTGLSKKLQNQIYLDETIKTPSTNVRFTIDCIHVAISENRKINYQYGKYNVDKEFKLNREGELYSVKPYALIWNNDYYYLIGEYEKLGQIRHYRIDRMRSVTVQDEQFKRNPFNVAEYVNKTFNMYSGEEQPIEIQIDNSLINVMIDRFGRNVDIRKVDDNSFILKTNASVSDGLVGWLLMWGGQAKVLKPGTLVQKLKEESQKLYKQYNEK